MTAQHSDEVAGFSSRLEQIEADYLARCAAIVKQLAPDQFGEFWSSSDSVIRLMDDERGVVRAAAVYAGFSKWKLGSNSSFQAKCQKMALGEEGPAQEAAITVLGEIFYATKAQDILQLLTSILGQARLSNDARNIVHSAMHRIEYGFEFESVHTGAVEIIERKTSGGRG